MSPMRLAVISRGRECTEQERQLADLLAVPLLRASDPMAVQVPLYVLLRAKGITLCSNEPLGPRHGLIVDFSSTRLHNRQIDRFRQQNLAKAIGLKAHRTLTVIDATAGLGMDAYLLACAGCQVTLVERHKLIHAMLADGMKRAQSNDGGSDGNRAGILARMQLLRGDIVRLSDQLPRVDVVYLDPMFQERGRTARSGKGMYLLQSLLGDEEEDACLIRAAAALARRRVVVKRARHAAPYADQRPDSHYQGSSSRYDVYHSHQAMRSRIA